MRTWIKILIIVAIIVVVNTLVTSYLSSEHEFYEGRLTELSLMVENHEEEKAQEIVDEVCKHWARSHQIWETLAEHYEIERIDILFSKLYKYFPSDQNDEMLSDITELYRLIEFTAGRYKVSLVNIL